jgi:hypothetical protein
MTIEGTKFAIQVCEDGCTPHKLMDSVASVINQPVHEVRNLKSDMKDHLWQAYICTT